MVHGNVKFLLALFFIYFIFLFCSYLKFFIDYFYLNDPTKNIHDIDPSDSIFIIPNPNGEIKFENQCNDGNKFSSEFCVNDGDGMIDVSVFHVNVRLI